MVGIIAGSLGFSQSTASDSGVLNKDAATGQTLGRVAVNVATGSSAVEFTDEVLSVAGLDISHARYSYSNQTTIQDDQDADGWTNGVRRIVETVAPPATKTDGVTFVTYVNRDGSFAKAYWNTAAAAFVFKSGTGSHDTIAYSSANSGEWTITDGDTQRKELVKLSTGKIMKVTDPSGNGFNYFYGTDGINGYVSTITDIRSGKVFVYSYVNNKLDNIGIKANSTAALVKEVTYNYDTSGRLWKVNSLISTTGDAAKGLYTTTYEYFGTTKNVSKITQSDGTIVEIDYYANNQVKSVKDRNGTTKFEYINATTKVTDGALNVTTYTYDANKQIKSITSTLGDLNNITRSLDYGYDADGNINKITDSFGNVTDRRFDTKGNLIKQRDAEGNTYERKYDAKNNLVLEIRYKAITANIDEVIADYSYDPVTTRYIYDSANRLRFTVSGEGRVTENIYTPSTTNTAPGNAFGFVSATKVYADGFYPYYTVSPSTQLFESDLNNWLSGLTTTQKQIVQWTTYTYDGLGNLSETRAFGNVNADGTVPTGAKNTELRTKYVYDQHGMLLKKFQYQALDTTPTTVIQEDYVYDGVGRLILIADKNGGRSIGYASLTVTTTNDGKSQDGKGIDGDINIPDVGTGLITEQKYDDKGRLTSVINKNSTSTLTRTTQYVYDDAGRLFKTIGADNVAVSYQYYNAAGQVSYVIDAVGAITQFWYDANGRLSKEERYSKALSATTLAGLTKATAIAPLIQLGNGGQDERTVSYKYDKAGRLTRVDKNDGSGTDYGNHTTTKVYDGMSRVTDTTEESYQVPTRSTSYSYDNDGLLKQSVDAEGNSTYFKYDDAGRLTVKTFAAFSLPYTEYERYYYDAQGRQVGMVDRQGFLTETIYEPGLFKTTTKRYQTALDMTSGYSYSTLAAERAAAGIALTTTQTFDQYGRLKEVTAPDGSKTQYFYDVGGRLIRKTEPLTVSRDRTTNATTISSRQTYIQYNIFNETTGQVSGSGAASLTSSSTAAAITTAINASGRRFTYDAMGRTTSETGPNATTTNVNPQKTFFYYDKNGRLTYTANVLGEVAKTEYTAFGQVKSTTVFANRIAGANLTNLINNGGGSETLIAGGPDLATNPSKIVIDIAQDSTIQHAYQKFGSESSITDAEGNVTSFTYSALNELERVWSIKNNHVTAATDFARNNLGQVTTTTNSIWDGQPAGSWITKHQTPDIFGRITSINDPLGHITNTVYALGGREVTITDATNRTSKTTYDALGRVATSVDGFGNITKFTYDAVARTTVIDTPELTKVTTWYNEAGDKLQVKDANGNITNYTYTLDGQLDKVYDGNNVVIEDNNYDASGRLIEVIDANGTKIAYTYDAAHRVLTRTVDPTTTTPAYTGLNLKTTYTYTAKGEQFTVTQGTGAEATTTKYIYYRDGRLKQTIVDDGTGKLNLSTKLTYDNQGNVTLVEKGTFASPAQTTTKYTYDGLGRKLSEIIDPLGLAITTQYVYDDAGNISKVIDARGNSTWNFYDDANRLIRSINAVGTVTEFNYNANGQVWKTVERASPSTATLSLDAHNRAVGYIPVDSNPFNDKITIAVFNKDGRQTHTIKAATALFGSVWSPWTVEQTVYDKGGRVTETRRYAQILILEQINRFSMDSQITPDELTSIPVAGGGTISFTATTPPIDTIVTKFDYDANNRLTKVTDAENGVTEYKYDKAGNKTQVIDARLNKTWHFYDNANRLTRTINQEGGVTEYTYNSLGQVWKTITRANPFTGTLSLDATTKKVTGYGSGVAADLLNDRTTIAVYDLAGRQTHTLKDTGPMGWAVTQMVYDAVDNVTATYGYANYLSNGDVTTFSNDGQFTINELKTKSFTTAQTDTRITRYAYDANNRLRFTVDAEGSVTRNSYDSAGNLTALTKFGGNPYAVGATPLTESDMMAWALTRTDTTLNPTPDIRVTSYVYDNVGRLRFTINAEGYVTGNTYDSFGNVASITEYKSYFNNPNFVYSEGTVQQWASDTEALNTLDSPTFRRTRYRYDQLGRQVLTILPGYYSATNGQVYSVSGYGFERQIEVTYDALGNAVANRISTGFSDSDCIIQNKIFDKAGRLVFDIDGLGYVTKYVYNALGLVETTIRYERSLNEQSGLVPDLILQPGHTAWWSKSNVELALSNLRSGSRSITTAYDKVGRKLNIKQDVTSYPVSPVEANTTYYGGNFAQNAATIGNDFSARPETEYKYNAFGEISVEKTRVRAAGTGVIGEWAETHNTYNKVGHLIKQVQNNCDQAGNYLYYATVNSFTTFGEVEKTIEYATGMTSKDANPVASNIGANNNSPLDRITHFKYDKAGRVTHTLKSNIQLSEQVGDAWNSKSVASTDSILISNNVYDAYGDLKISKNALDSANLASTLYSYTKLGKLTQITEQARTVAGKQNDPFAGQISDVTPLKIFFYDGFGNLSFEITQKNNDLARGDASVVLHFYDVAGNEISTQDREGNLIKKQYDVAGRVIKTQQDVNVTSAMSSLAYTNTIEQRFAYDAAGRQIATVDLYDGNQISGQYNYFNAFGEVTQEERIWGTTANISGQSTQLTAAEAKTLADATASSQTVNKYTYDNAGRIATKQSSDGTTYYYYDLTGKVTRSELRNSIDSTKRITEAYYDLRGNTLKQRLPSFAGTTMTVAELKAISFTYNPTGVIGNVPVPVATSPLTPTITQVYDRWGNVLKSTDAAGQSTDYEYDYDNRVIKETGPEVDAWKMNSTNTAFDSVKTKLIHTATYNLLGQLATEEFSSSTQILGDKRYKFNVYNNVGQLIKVSDWAYKNTINTARNQINKITEEYAYDALGNRVGTRSPNGTMNNVSVTVYAYDRNSQLVSTSKVRNLESGLPSKTYDPYSTAGTKLITISEKFYDQAGRVYADTGMSGGKTYYTYDDRGLLQSSNFKIKDPSISVYSTGLDPNLGPDGTLIRSYSLPTDPNNPTIRTVNNPGVYRTATYQYDQFGNKTYQRTAKGETETWTYKTGNFEFGRTATHGAGGIDYTLKYTGFGQVEREEQTSSPTTNFISYVYSASGLLSSKTDTTDTISNLGAAFSTNYLYGQTFKTDYLYDIRGNLTKEENLTISKRGAPWADSSQSTNLYGYDSLGRLTLVRSPQRDMYVSQATSQRIKSSEINALEFNYDEWGNRAYINSSYWLVNSTPITRPTKKEYFTYDASGRTLVDSGQIKNGKIVVSSAGGVIYAYDDIGRLQTAESFGGTIYPLSNEGNPNPAPTGDGYNVTLYSYNDLNQTVREQNRTRTRAIGAASDGAVSNEGNYDYGVNNAYNFQGWLYESKTESQTTTYIYLPDGTLSYQEATHISGSTTKSRYEYDANTGEMTKSSVESYQTGSVNWSANNYTYHYKDTYAGRQNDVITAIATQNGNQTGTGTGATANAYDQRGRLISSEITQISGNSSGKGYKSFNYNADGFIISTATKDYNTTPTNYKGEVVYYAQGGQLAKFSESLADISPLNAIQMSGVSPSTLILAAGDTLAGIAQRVYGDSSLWYVIADANGLNLGPSEAFGRTEIGRAIIIPNTSQAIKNNSTTFKPYNPTEVIGDLTPTPTILPPPKQGCNAIATIIMVVVMVIVTVYTAGAATAMLAPAGTVGTGFAAGLTALGGGIAGASGSVVAASIAGSVIGGIAGSVASQLVGKAMGVVEHFSLRQAVGNGLTAGFTAGAGAILQLGKVGALIEKAGKATSLTAKTVTNLARGAAGYLGSYHSNKIAGLETHFNWTDMAVSTISAGITGKTGDVVPDAISNMGNGFFYNVANNFWGGAVNASLSRLLGRGDEPDWGAMAADAFGNAIGTFVVEGLAAPKVKPVVPSDSDELLNADGIKKFVEDLDRMNMEGAASVEEYLREGRMEDGPKLPGESTSAPAVRAATKNKDVASVTLGSEVADALCRKPASYEDMVNGVGLEALRGDSTAPNLRDHYSGLNLGADDVGSIRATEGSDTSGMVKRNLNFGTGDLLYPTELTYAEQNGFFNTHVRSLWGGDDLGQNNADVDAYSSKSVFGSSITYGDVADVTETTIAVVGLVEGGLGLKNFLSRLDNATNSVKNIFARDAVNLDEFNRLNVIDSAVGRARPGEAGAAVEIQNYLGGRLERAASGTQGDFIFASGEHAGKTVDFMLTPDNLVQAQKINNFFGKNVSGFTDQLTSHLGKADFVPMDMRFLTKPNQNILMDIINMQPPKLQSKIILLR